MNTRFFALLIPVLLMGCSEIRNTPTQRTETPVVATFSIVAYDPETKELGVAVQSKIVAVGAVVPFAFADLGAIATQAAANTSYGPKALKMMAAGKTPEEVLKALVESDKFRDHRQFGIVNAKGVAVTYTGSKCLEWAGGLKGKNYVVQGNILASEKVVAAMAEKFEKSKGELGKRMIDALQAGQEAGGDRRGKQSAALLVVKKRGGYGGYNDRYRDIRVDDHKEPIKELRRIYELHKKQFPAK